MKVTLITVGKIKEKFFQDAIAEYSKRLSRYCKLEIVQVADEKTPDGASEAVETQIKEKEGERILSNIKDGSFVVALAINGNMLDSEELAAKIEKWGVSGISQIVFIIGGSLGLSNQVLARADYKLSFSKMTFPHQLMRVILLEQIYRSYRIIQGEPYHKKKMGTWQGGKTSDRGTESGEDLSFLQGIFTGADHEVLAGRL